MFGGAAASDASGTFVTSSERFADAACGVFRKYTLQVRMGGEEAFALRQGHGMRSDGAKIGERCAGAADEVMLDGQDRFRGNGESAFQKKVIDAHDGSRQGVFDRGQECVGGTLIDGAKGGIEGGTRHSRDAFAEKSYSGFFAESSGLALIGNTHLECACRDHECFYHCALPMRFRQCWTAKALIPGQARYTAQRGEVR